MTKCLGKPPIWGMVPEIQSGGKIFSSFWAIFCPFTSLTTRKIKILKKWKKLLERSSFYTCNKNHDLMMYASWDIEHDRQNFLSFWASFCPFSPLTTQKIKILKKWKKTPGEISSFYTSVPKIMIRCYTVPEARCVMDAIVIFHFGLFSALLPY